MALLQVLASRQAIQEAEEDDDDDDDGSDMEQDIFHMVGGHKQNLYTISYSTNAKHV